MKKSLFLLALTVVLIHFLRQSITYLIEDGTGPSYACSRGLDEGYQKNGLPRALARMRQKVGCNWTALPGIEYPLQDVTRMCLVTPFTLAFAIISPDVPLLNVL